MRLLCLGLAAVAFAGAVACGTASESASTSTSAVNRGDNLDGGDVGPVDSDAGPAAEVDAGLPAPPPLLPSVDTTPLVLDGPPRSVAYTPDAPFTAFELHAAQGTALAFLVDSRTRGATAAIWLTDATFRAVASSNTHSGTAYLTYNVTSSGAFYLVLREGHNQAATFEITVTGGGAQPGADRDAGE